MKPLTCLTDKTQNITKKATIEGLSTKLTKTFKLIYLVREDKLVFIFCFRVAVTEVTGPSGTSASF